jgi:glutathione S-transferase
MLRIWGRTNSINVQKVMWAVGELGLEHERIDVGGQFGRLDTPEYGALNPNRLVPTVEDGGAVVWESNACVRYLAARYGAGGLWPEDAILRSASDRWMDWQITRVQADMTVIFWGLIRTPPEKRDMAAINAATARLGDIWRVLDHHLASHLFVAGDRLTMGDIPAGSMCHRYQELPIERPKLPNHEAWYGRLRERAPYREHVMLPLT